MSAVVVESPVPQHADWQAMPVGAGTAAQLAGCQMRRLGETELVEAMAAARRLEAWAASLQLEAMAELSRRYRDAHGADDAPGADDVPGADDAPPDHRFAEPGEVAIDEVSLALTLTGGAAAQLVGIAEKLHGPMSKTRAALRAGLIDLPRVKVIVDGLVGVEPAVADQVESEVIVEASRLTTGQLRHRIRKLICQADPHAAQQQRATRHAGRSLQVWDEPAGTANLALCDISAQDAHAIWNKINAAAHAMRRDGAERPLEAIRADVATDLLRGVPLPEATWRLMHEQADGAGHAHDNAASREPADEAMPGSGAPPATAAAEARQIASARAGAAMVASLLHAQLTDLADHARAGGLASGEALLVERATRAVRRSVADVKLRWCHLRPEPDGRARHGHDGYVPPAAMRRLVDGRDARCVFPTCDRPASACDRDHTEPYQHSRITCPCNLAVLCRRHHRLKQTRRWKALHPWPGVLVWITPAGHWYINRPGQVAPGAAP